MNKNPTYTKSNRSVSSSNSRLSSNSGVKMRTVLKSRGNIHSRIQDERYLASNKIQSMDDLKVKNKMSTSMMIQNNSVFSMKNTARSFKSTNNNNTTKRQQTLNCQQQLLGKQDFQYLYQKLMNQLTQLERQADSLILAKIKKVSKKSRVITLKNKGKDEFTQQIQALISRIRQLKSDDLQRFDKNQHKIRYFIDRKILLLQKLMAEGSTESDLLKNHFFAINAMRSQEKLGKIIQKTRKTNQKFFLQPLGRSKTQVRQEKKAIFRESSNQQSYHPPKLSQYETYRYKAKSYCANLQPLPRSSYKKDFLLYGTGSGKQSPIKNLDHYTILDKSRVKTSTYTNDYHNLKADVINYKELDSYKNKIKNLQVKFMNRNREQQSQKQFQLNKSYITQQLQMNIYSKKPKPPNIYPNKSTVNNSKNNKTFDLKNPLVFTQSKREYKGHQKQIVSNIKHKRLHNLKYAYKSLVNQ